MILFWVQFSAVMVIFLFSAFVSWYEGSSILTDPWEWKYSTPFSQWLHGEVTAPSDISGLDHFIYAAKFSPIFPSLMTLSVIYLFILIGYFFFKRKPKSLAVYIMSLGALSLLASITAFNSSTDGGQVFFYLLLICAVLCFAASTFIYKRRA